MWREKRIFLAELKAHEAPEWLSKKDELLRVIPHEQCDMLAKESLPASWRDLRVNAGLKFWRGFAEFFKSTCEQSEQ